MNNVPIDISGVKLETERLVLRPFAPNDLQDFYDYAKVPGVGECAGWRHHSDLEESRNILGLFIKEKKTFALVYKENNKVIGSIGLEECRFPTTYYPTLSVREIGYVLSKDYWGHGLMSEAIQAVISYCFDTLDLDALSCCHFEGNERSRRVILKAGFSYLFTNEYETRMGTIIKENRCYLLLNPKHLVR